MTQEELIAEAVSKAMVGTMKISIIMAMIAYTAFLIKHFICDFPLQAFPYMYKNKGTYGHPGGLLHAGIHGIGTFLILMSFGFYLHHDFKNMLFLACYLGLVDMLIHYHIDWAKMNLNAKMGWKPNNSEKFWILLGVDQLLHNLTYVGFIVWFVI